MFVDNCYSLKDVKILIRSKKKELIYIEFKINKILYLDLGKVK